MKKDREGLFVKKMIIALVLMAVMLFVTVVPGYAAGPPNRWSQVGGLWDVVPNGGNAAWVYNSVYSFITVNGTLYAGTNDGVRAWNGSSWIRVGNSVNMGGVFSLFSINGLLYAGTDSAGVWVWDGSNWSQLGKIKDQFGDSINCLLEANGILYAGTYSSGVWSWDGSNWSQVGGSTGLPKTTYSVQSLLAVNKTVYAGTQGGVWAWDGSNWSQVGDLCNSIAVVSVNAGFASHLFTVDGKVYAGGHGLWAWDGSNWSEVDKRNRSSIPDDFGPAGQMLMANDGSNAMFNGKLYAGSDDGVWSWNGSEWSQIGDVPNDNHVNVNCLIVTNDTLYIGTTGNGVWGMTIPGILPNTIKFTIGSKQYISGGVANNTDVAPFSENGRTYMGIRAMGYVFGMDDSDIVWNHNNNTAAFNYDGHTIIFKLGSSTYMVDGSTKQMDVTPIDVNGRICIPARFFAQVFGYQVSWDQANNAVLLNMHN